MAHRRKQVHPLAAPAMVDDGAKTAGTSPDVPAGKLARTFSRAGVTAPFAEVPNRAYSTC